MKKIYTKPQIAFEDFVLNCSIAATTTCEFTLRKDKERFKLSDGTYIFTSEAGCESWADPSGMDAAYNGICYHVPTEVNVFDS